MRKACFERAHIFFIRQKNTYYNFKNRNLTERKNKRKKDRSLWEETANRKIRDNNIRS